MGALRLNNSQYISDCLQSTSVPQIPLVISSLPLMYAERLLKWMVEGNVMSSTRHVHFYMIWLRAILPEHGMQLKGRSDVATLTGIQQIVAHHQQHISKLANQNKFSLDWLVKVRKSKEAVKKMEEDSENEENEEEEESEEEASEDEDSDSEITD